MRLIKKGSTDQSVVIRIVDSGDGTPETGVVFNSAGIDLWYRREGAVKTSITEATLSALNDAHSDGGILHIGDGYYRLDLPDAAFATGANGVMVGGTVTGMVVIGCYVPLVDFDPQDAVRAGLTALPNAAADAAGGLPISDAGGLDLDAQRTDVAAILVDTADMQPKLGTPAGASISADIAAIEAQTDDIGAAGAGLTALATAAAVAALDTKLGTPAGASIAADLAQIEAQTDDIGVAGAGLTALGDTRLANLDATVSSRATAASISALASDLALVLGHVDTEVAAILQDTDVTIPGLIAALGTLIDAVKAKTDLLPAAPAAVSDIPTAVQNADALLGRSIQGGANGGRTVTSAFRKVRNRVAIAGGTMTTYAEDDTTPDHTAAVTTAAGNPITEVDPV